MDTRWNSIYKVAVRILRLRPAIENYLDVNVEDSSLFDSELQDGINWNDIQHLTNILVWYERCFTLLQSDNKPCYSLAMGSVYKLSNIILNSEHPMKAEFYEPLSNRLGTVSDEQAMAAFFAPEFKHLQFVSDDIRDRVYNKIKEIVPLVEETNDAWDQFSSNANELDAYLGETITKAIVRMSPYEYWNQNRVNYQTLAALAKLQLLKLGSSASAERLFSDASSIEKRKRYHMLDDTLECYILSRSGFKNKLL